MDKKHLILVSLCAVVLLVLGSLSTVVGYQSVKSIAVNDSPLFQTRTRRAINQQQDILTSQYLGMGKQNLLQFPFRDDRTAQLKKTLDIISKMDEKVFTHFTDLVIQHTRQDDSFRGINTNEIVQILHKIRTQPDATINSLMRRSNGRLDPTNFNCASILFFEPGCTWKLVIVVIIVLLAPILVPLIQLGNIITIIFNCYF